MIRHFSILKTVIPFIIPYILLYSLYIQINGEVSPGGGFQAGVIFASGIIAFDLIIGYKKMHKLLCEKSLIIISVMGVLIYLSVGCISLIFADNFLNYNNFATHHIKGQHLGIFAVEIGIGITVAAVMCIIYINIGED